MVKKPAGPIVAKAEQKSVDIIQDYLMNEASDIHATSAPLINFNKKKKSKKEKKSKKKSSKSKRRGSEGSSSTSTAAGTSDSGCEDCDRPQGSPVSFLLEELRKVSPSHVSPRTFPALQMYHDFEEWTDAQKNAYDRDAIAAIRAQDIKTLRKWHQEGRILQAANSFGESLLHMACRRGFLKVVQFLVDEAGHNLWIRDDTGRTPLHDACWTAEPCPELVQYILKKQHDLILVSDKRGHTPLDYARKDHWEFWIDYLSLHYGGADESSDFTILLPKRDCFYIQTSAPEAEPAADPATTATTTADDNDARPSIIMLENVDGMLQQLNLDLINNMLDDPNGANMPLRRSSCPGQPQTTASA